MKKALTAIIAVTLLSSLYVYQHARLIEYSYFINTGRHSLSLLIDRNRSLRYNISRLESPARLEKVITSKQDAQVYIPLDCYNVKVKEPVVFDSMVVTSFPLIHAGKMVLSMFLFGTEAVAEEPK